MEKNKLVVGAKNILHHFNQQQYPGIVNKVINTVGLFFRAENVFFSEYGQMLGNVALAGTYLFDNLLYADGIIAQNAQYF